jgi:DNA-binding IclR family transcriptional regulator
MKKENYNMEQGLNQKKDNPQWPAGTRSIRRTTNILRAIAKFHRNGASLSKISREVDLPIPTVKRILTILVLEGFVAFSNGSKQYYLGIELYKISQQSWPLNIQETYQLILERLAQKTGDTVYLIIPSGSDGLCIDLAEGQYSVRIPYGIGSRVGLGVGTSGLCLLSILPDDKIEKIMWKNRVSYQNYGVTNEEIWENIRKFKSIGYVRYDSKFVEGLVGVAVPIKDQDGNYIASITISSTEKRMPHERCKRLQRLINDEIKSIDA